MAKLAHDSYPFPDFTGSYREQYEAQHAELARLAAEADTNGTLVGQVLRWQRADGYAVYVVTSERPLTLQHVDIGDGYTVESALIRGLDRNDVEDMVARERAIRDIFSKKD